MCEVTADQFTPTETRGSDIEELCLRENSDVGESLEVWGFPTGSEMIQHAADISFRNAQPWFPCFG